jgi:hypothetical protein
MREKKPDRLSASTEAARAPAPSPPQDQGERVSLTYRTTRANWERIKLLAIRDRVSVQALFQTALSHEFERRGLPALED